MILHEPKVSQYFKKETPIRNRHQLKVSSFISYPDADPFGENGSIFGSVSGVTTDLFAMWATFSLFFLLFLAPVFSEVKETFYVLSPLPPRVEITLS